MKHTPPPPPPPTHSFQIRTGGIGPKQNKTKQNIANRGKKYQTKSAKPSLENAHLQ